METSATGGNIAEWEQPGHPQGRGRPGRDGTRHSRVSSVAPFRCYCWEARTRLLLFWYTPTEGTPATNA